MKIGEAKMDRDELADYLDSMLAVSIYRDYCPNGRQVEGCARIEKRVTGGLPPAAR
jgi:hypothetical protein